MAQAVTDRTHAPIVAPLRAQADTLDAAAEPREHRTDAAIAERTLARALASLEECGRAGLHGRPPYLRRRPGRYSDASETSALRVESRQPAAGGGMGTDVLG